MRISGSLQAETREGVTPALRSGRTVAVRVVQNLGKGLFQASIGGKLFRVTSDAHLSVGDAFSAKVSWFSGRLVLRIIEVPLVADSALKDLGLPLTPLTKAAVDALQRSSMTLDRAAVEWISSKIRNTPHNERDRPHLARILSLLYGKGIHADDRSIDALLSLSLGGKTNSRDTGGKKREKHDEKRDGDDELHRDASPVRSASDPNPVSLFNHIRTGRTDWIIIPFHSVRGSKEMGGVIRIRIPSPGAPPDGLVVCVRSDDSEWSFACESGRSRKIRVIKRDGRKIDEYEQFTAFSEKLRNLGFEIDDNELSAENFDGFMVNDPKPRRSVDELV